MPVILGEETYNKYLNNDSITKIDYNINKISIIIPKIIYILQKSNPNLNQHEDLEKNSNGKVSSDSVSYMDIFRYMNYHNVYPLYDDFVNFALNDLQLEALSPDIIKKKKYPNEVTGEFDRNLYQKCIEKFVDRYIVCKLCKSTSGIIFSRKKSENEVLGKPFKKCSNCLNWFWLEEEIRNGSQETSKLILTSEKEEKFSIIQEIKDSILLKQEICLELRVCHFDEIIEFLINDIGSLSESLRQSFDRKDKSFSNCLVGTTTGRIDGPLVNNKNLLWDYDEECEALDILTRIYVLLSKFKLPDVSLKKYHNYIIVNTLLKKLSRPQKQIDENTVILKYLFDSSYEKQSELLFIVIEVIMNNHFDFRGKEETIFSYFYNNRILDIDFQVDWKNGSPKIYNKNLQNILLYSSEIDRKFKNKVKNFLNYIEQDQKDEWNSDESSSTCSKTVQSDSESSNESFECSENNDSTNEENNVSI